jgi:dedicator of cytokinesis protein 3
VIDAAVNGGIAKYQDAFFTPNFLTEFPSHLLHVAKLQKLMLEQVNKNDTAAAPRM